MKNLMNTSNRKPKSLSEFFNGLAVAIPFADFFISGKFWEVFEGLSFFRQRAREVEFGQEAIDSFCNRRAKNDVVALQRLASSSKPDSTNSLPVDTCKF
jgi:hypothetical protein